MKPLKEIFSLLFLLFFLLAGCKKEAPSENGELVRLEPGSPAYYYEKGYNTSEIDEKLDLYNAGLEAIEDKRDSNLVALLEGKIYALIRKGRHEQTEKWIDSLITTARYQKDTFYLAKGYYRKSLLHAFRNEPELQFKNAFLARQLYLQDGETAMAARRSFDMATAQLEMGDYPGSQESAAETIKYLKPDSRSDSIFLSAAYNLIGLAYMDQGFNTDAIKEYKNALRYAARERDSLTFLHNIALSYKNDQKYDEAIAILEEIAASKVPDSSSRSFFIDNLAYTRWLKDSTKNVDSLFFEALKMRKVNNDLTGLYTSYSHLANYYENKDKKEAINYARASLETARKIPSATSEVAALKLLISLLDSQEEQKYVDRYIFLHDSIDKVNLKAKNYFAKIKLDEQKKQEEINSLEEVNYKQALEAERLQNRNVISTIVAVFLFFAAILLYFYFKQRNKRERLKGIYLTEKRISKRIHDELANDVYNLMSKLEDSASPEVNDKLAKIYYRTRDISRENSEIDTGTNYLPNLVAVLSSLAGNAKIILQGEKTVNWQRIEEEKKVVIYRVLQELLVNMKKHSKARFVAISFVENGKWLEINYKDNGAGCTASCLKSGNGLNNIRNRVSSVNGKIDIESEKGKGFKVEIRIPV